MAAEVYTLNGETENTFIKVDTVPPEYSKIQLNHKEEIKKVKASNSTIQKSSNDEPLKQKRDSWSNHAEFMLSCIGFSVGLGNIWRFPYVCYANGGGAFLIPYFIMLILCGLPMYFMELSLGQYTGYGPPRSFELCPLILGVGWAQIIILFIISIFYNIIMAYALLYLVSSFKTILPWTHCDNIFNTKRCALISSRRFIKTTNLIPTTGDVGSNYTAYLNYTPILNMSTKDNYVSPTDEFWHHYVLEISKSNGLHDMGGLRWPLVGLLFVSWILVFACIFKGIKSLGKVAYFTTILPYIILFVLFVRGVTLDGAKDGILYFLTPRWDKLMEIKVWSAAAGQAFFSAGIGWGCLISFASFASYRNPSYRDSVIIALLDTFTSIFSGLVIFAVLGYMAKQLKVPISEVTSSGQGLAFIVYPEAISQLPIPQLWNVLFFVMLYDLGLNSEFALMEAFTSGLQDSLPRLFPYKRRIFNRFLFCMICFLLGLPCVTRGGQYVITLLDYFSSEISLVFIGGVEIVGIMWIYGYRKFLSDIESMLQKRLPFKWFWMACWIIICPILLWTIFIYSITQWRGLRYLTYEFPVWGNWVGGCVSLFSLIPIPIFGFYAIVKQRRRPIVQAIANATKPNEQFLNHLRQRAIDAKNEELSTMSTNGNNEDQNKLETMGMPNDDKFFNMAMTKI